MTDFLECEECLELEEDLADERYRNNQLTDELWELEEELDRMRDLREIVSKEIQSCIRDNDYLLQEIKDSGASVVESEYRGAIRALQALKDKLESKLEWDL